MKITLEIEDEGAVSQTVACDAGPEETLLSVIKRLAEQLGLDVDEMIPDLGDDHDCAIPHGAPDRTIRHRRVCIDLHFETERARHFFSPHARWARVHHWGCKHFHVAHDACANLELREGDPQGSALNDSKRIDKFKGCKIVWLIKPGAEQNG